MCIPLIPQTISAMTETILSNMTHSTIAAISTPPHAKGGVAIIRISGPDALAVARQVFIPRGKAELCKERARYAIFGDITYEGRIIDDGLATYFPAPHSYTGEDVVEISCHGGVLVTRMVLRAILAAGADMAEAGEFTRRAFVNGRLSLGEAESIGQLLDAKTEDQVLLHSSRSRQRLKEAISDISDALTSLLASVFARIDYPDEDLGELTHEEIKAVLSGSLSKCEALLRTYKTGSAISLGIPTVICGLANAGKSTLFNLLSGEELAIVTDIAGTTRDVLRGEVTLGGVLLKLCDTAGLRAGDGVDTVEKIGIERALDALDGAELVLALFDKDALGCSENEALAERISGMGNVRLALITKCDADSTQSVPEYISSHFDEVFFISAKERPDEAKRLISDKISSLFTDGSVVLGEDAIISDERQRASLTRACESIRLAISSIDAGAPEEIIASDIERATQELLMLDGRAVSEAVVGEIFKRFCVGK